MTTVKECEQLYTSTDKWKVSLIAGSLFLVMSLLYSFTDRISQSFGFLIMYNRYPTFIGVIIHALVFAVIVRILLI